MASWSSSFESYPTGSNFGSSSGSAIRELRSLVQEKFELEHTFDLDASPVCPHIAGKCRIVGLVDAEPSYKDVLGALWYDYANKVFYRDRGAGLGGDVCASFNHSSLLNLTDTNAHGKYVLPAGNASDMKVYIVDDTFTNLPTDEGAAWTTNAILSYGAHIGESTSGGAKHADEVVGEEIHDGLPDRFISWVKLATDSFDQTFQYEYTWNFSGKSAFFFEPADSYTHDTTYLLPLFNGSPPDDYIAGITFHNNGINQRIAYSIKRVAEV